MAFEAVKHLLVNANVNNAIPSANESPMAFGGGEYSGGGAGGSF